MKERVLALLAATAAAAAMLVAASGLALGADVTTAEISAASPAPLTPEASYRINEEDVLRLDVWGEQQLSNTQMQVTPDGKINVAFLGEMQASGLTQAELCQQIAKKLADAEILKDAKVQITIMTLHRPLVHMLGAFLRPGSVEFKDGDTVYDAIAQGGSYTDDAMLESASLTHRGSSKPIPIDLKKMLAGDFSQNCALENGDSVYIPHEDYNNKIYVLGEVNRPGQYPLKDKTPLLAAISLAGGQTEKGAISKTIVVRGDPAKPERVKVNLDALFKKHDLSQNIALRPGDIVVVPESKKADWSMIASIISAATNLSWLRRTGW